MIAIVILTKNKAKDIAKNNVRSEIIITIVPVTPKESAPTPAFIENSNSWVELFFIEFKSCESKILVN